MIRLLNVRRYHARQTLGRLIVFSGITVPPVFECACLELPWMKNKKYVSCIPEGVYPCEKMISGTFGHIISVNDVPDRSLIRIHQGNYISDVLGCLLPGKEHVFLDKDDLHDVNYSKRTLKELMSYLPDEFEMKIVSI